MGCRAMTPASTPGGAPLPTPFEPPALFRRVASSGASRALCHAGMKVREQGEAHLYPRHEAALRSRRGKAPASLKVGGCTPHVPLSL